MPHRPAHAPGAKPSGSEGQAKADKKRFAELEAVSSTAKRKRWLEDSPHSVTARKSLNDLLGRRQRESWTSAASQAKNYVSGSIKPLPTGCTKKKSACDETARVLELGTYLPSAWTLEDCYLKADGRHYLPLRTQAG